MSSLLASQRAFVAFQSGPLRSKRRVQAANSCLNKQIINLKALQRDSVPASDCASQKTHQLETGLLALLASGALAGSCFAADDVESASQAVQAAKLASDILRPLFNIFTILYIVRVPMTWYPDIDGKKMPWLIAYAPTEPTLSVTRKVVPLVSGVDVSPIVWVGLISFFSEILLGPQGLLTLIQARGGL